MLKASVVFAIALALVLSLASCGDAKSGLNNALRAVTPANRSTSTTQKAGNITEVSPPETILQLRQVLETYQPQVKILSPQPGEVLEDETVRARFQVQDLPIFKNQEFEMGSHLHVILDNQPYIAVYDLNQPLVLPDLSPGTHTLRVFASRPWHESFKNDGAYAQTTFHIFTKTDDNNPTEEQPLLTYSRPKGSYGAEPILLDFYLTNAPLHLVAQENPGDAIADWRIRCTINGNSFVIDRWEAIYLKGFKPGKNWVQLEFLDEQGNPVKNVFNNTVRVITYEPKANDTLSKLTRGELSADEVRGIVEQNYTPIKETEPAPTPIPTPEVEETTPAEPQEEPAATEIKPEPTATPLKEPPATKQPEPTPTPLEEPAATEIKPEPTAEEPAETNNQKAKGFFNRFQRPSVQPSPTLPEVMESPVPESTTPENPELESPLSQPEATPEEPKPKSFQVPPQERLGGYFSRLRRPSVQPSPNLPEIIESPSESIPENVVPNELPPQPEATSSE